MTCVDLLAVVNTLFGYLLIYSPTKTTEKLSLLQEKDYFLYTFKNRTEIFERYIVVGYFTAVSTVALDGDAVSTFGIRFTQNMYFTLS